jgi:hypothetical protein
MTKTFRILGLGAGLSLALAACTPTTGGGPGGEGSCGAADHQSWVGQRVDVLNDVELPEASRVLFPTTPATMDYQPDRLNVEVDEADTIVRVYCG